MVDRLDEKSVDAGLAAFQFVFVAGAGSDGNDRNLAPFRQAAYAARRLIAVHFRHHHIHYDQTGLEAVEQCQAFQPAAGAGYAEAQRLQQIHQHQTILRHVVDDQQSPAFAFITDDGAQHRRRAAPRAGQRAAQAVPAK